MNFPVSFQARSSIFESIGLECGHRKSLIPIVTFEVLLWIQPARHGDDTHEDLKFQSVSSFTRRSSRNLWVFPPRWSWKWTSKAGSSTSRSPKTGPKTNTLYTTRVSNRVALYSFLCIFQQSASVLQPQSVGPSVGQSSALSQTLAISERVAMNFPFLWATGDSLARWGRPPPPPPTTAVHCYCSSCY